MDTKSLTLVNCDLPTVEAVLAGNDAIASYLNLKVPHNWTEHGEPAFKWTQTALTEHPTQAEWFTYLPILKSENTLIGSCGYVGPPKDGIVEIGYEICEIYRNRGYATELAQALTKNALAKREIKKVIAHTLAQENASTHVLKKCGFKKVGEITSEEDGELWLWERKRRFWWF